jgi:uncharacterized protein YukE
MKRFGLLAMVLAVVLLLPACGVQKKAAETAIAGAETALAAVKDQAVNVAPDEVKAIEDAIAAAKVSVESGEFKAAIDATKDLPAKIQEMQAGLAAKTEELQKGWDGLNATLPGAVAALDKKMGTMKKAPAGMEAAAWDGMKTSVADAKTKWGEAQAAVGTGNLAEAMAKGTEVKTAVADAMTKLKMPGADALK